MALRVMVVEDDHDVREALMALLHVLGWESDGAAHGGEALRLLEQMHEPPGLILLDLMMPVLDGRGFRERQLEHPDLAGIPVVVVSAFGHGHKTADELQAAGFLKKPIDVGELLSVVSQHCPLDSC